MLSIDATEDTDDQASVECLDPTFSPSVDPFITDPSSSSCIIGSQWPAFSEDPSPGGNFRHIYPTVRLPQLQTRPRAMPSPNTTFSMFTKDSNLVSEEVHSYGTTEFQYIAPDADLSKQLLMQPRRVSHTYSKERKNKNVYVSQPDHVEEGTNNLTGDLGFTSAALQAVAPNTTKLQREYLFPRATSQISYSDKRIHMRLTNKANDVRSAKPIIYAKCDNVGVRSSSALAILNPFKQPIGSLLYPRDEQALQLMKKAVRQSCNVKKQQFKSYAIAAATHLRNAVSEQGFYITKRGDNRSNFWNIQFARQQKSSPEDATNEVDDIRALYEEMLYRLKYSNFILKIIDAAEDDESDSISQSLALVPRHQSDSSEAPVARSPRIISEGSSIITQRITDDGVNYTITYDGDISTPIVVKIIADHSILELLFATYKDKKDLIRVVRDYEQEQIVFRMGLLQTTTNPDLATTLSGSAQNPRGLLLLSRKIQEPSRINRNRPGVTHPPFTCPRQPGLSDNQKSQIYNINRSLKELENKRKQRIAAQKPTGSQYSLLCSTEMTSPYCQAASLSPSSKSSMEDASTQRPTCASTTDYRPTDRVTHSLALSLLDTFSIRKTMYNTVFLEQSKKNMDDLLARTSQLREKLLRKRDIEAFEVEQKKKTSTNVSKSNKEVLSYMLSNHHDSRRILAKEDLELTIDKLQTKTAARDYFHGHAPDGANKAIIDDKQVAKMLKECVHEPLISRSKDRTREKTYEPAKHATRGEVTRMMLMGKKEHPLPRSLNFKTNIITYPAGPWKSQKVTLPDYYPN